MAGYDNFSDYIKSQVDIVDLISREVRLTKRGESYSGLCPFHSEKTPSFHVWEKTQTFKCFGCGAQGDIFTFTQLFYKLDGFIEARDKICKDYGITIEKGNPAAKRAYDKKKKFYGINKAAGLFYFNRIDEKIASGNNEVSDYLEKRGLDRKTIGKFGIGYAPDGGHELRDHLTSIGVSMKDMLELGLVKQGQNGIYDTFRKRLMFPIIDMSGNFIGFGGRIIGDGMPKYLNSSESGIFKKKETLYGLNFTRGDVTKADSILIVEGYMDAVSLYKHGIKNIAATLGTAITKEHGELITKRCTDNITLSYDSDEAGVNAAVRAIEVLRPTGASVSVLQIKDAKDPDEYVSKYGADAFKKLMGDAVPANRFILDRYKKDLDLSKEKDKETYCKRASELLAKLAPTEGAIWAKTVADEVGIPPEYMLGAVEKGENKTQMRRPVRKVSDAEDDPGAHRSERQFIEMHLVTIFCASERCAEAARERGITFVTEPAKTLLSFLEDERKRGAKVSIERLIEMLPTDLRETAAGFVDLIPMNVDIDKIYEDSIAKYYLNSYKTERARLNLDLRIAESKGEEEKIKELSEKIRHCKKKIEELKEYLNGTR